MADARAKLDWAKSRDTEMMLIFLDYAQPGGGDERPLGILWHAQERPRGLWIAKLIVDYPMPSEMSMLAADLIHNTRAALDHTVARLKDAFGGRSGRGGFPVCQTQEDWNERVVDAGRRSPLHGLADEAVELVYQEQPLHRDKPAADPMVILNGMDNDDKHRLLHPAFVHTRARTGLDLIEIMNPQQLVKKTNLWQAGEPLENGTKLATFLIRGDARDAVRARTDSNFGYATGNRERPELAYADMIERVRAVVDRAARLIDRAP